MSDFGDRLEDSAIQIDFTTHVGSTGALVAPSSAFTNSDFRIYKDGSATQKTTTNGITVTSPFDSITGKHLIEIDTSNDTGDSGFWTAGANYRVEINSAKTVDGVDQSGVTVGRFSIENRNVKADVRKWIGTAVSTPTTAGVPNVNAKTWNDLTTVALPLVPTTAGRTLDVSTGGEAGVDWANVGSPATTVALSGTTVANSTLLAGATTVVLTDGSLTAAKIAADAITAAKIADGAIDAATFAAGAINAAAIAADAITDAKVASDVTIASVTGAVGSVTGNVGGNVTGSVGSVTAAVTLPTMPTNWVTAAGLAADAVAEIQSGLATPTNITAATGVVLSGVTHTGAVIPTVSAVTGLTASNLDVAVSTLATQSSVNDLPTNAELATALAAADDAVLAAVATRASQTSLDTLDDLVDTEVAAIKAVTDQFVFTVANQVDANALSGGGGGGGMTAAETRAALGLASANLDTQLADLPTVSEFNARSLAAADYFVVSDYTAPANADITSILADTNELQTNQGNWLTATGFSTHSAADVWAVGTRTLTGFGTLVADVVSGVWAAATRTLSAFGFTPSLHADYDAAKTAATQTSVNTLAGYVDTEVAAIKAKTDNLPTDPADQSAVEAAITAAASGLASAAALTTVDTVVDAIQVVTDRLSGMLVVDGPVYQFTANALERSPSGSGGSTILVYPLNASMPSKTLGPNIIFYKNEVGNVVGPIAVSSRDGDTLTPVDLSTMELEVRFVDYLGEELFTSTDVTVSGTDDNQFEFRVTTDVTGTVTEEHEDQWHYWSLRDVTDDDDNVLVAGRARVLLA